MNVESKRGGGKGAEEPPSNARVRGGVLFSVKNLLSFRGGTRGVQINATFYGVAREGRSEHKWGTDGEHQRAREESY